jgi:hypothetical protein
MSKVMGVMLVSGEELIGSFEEKLQNKTTAIVKKPRVLALLTAPDGRQGLGLVPWVKANMDATVFVNKSQMVCEPYEVLAQIEESYLQETSGIQLASSLPQRGNGK